MKKFLISIAATICGFSVFATAQTEAQRIAEKFDKDGAFENGVWGMLAVRGQKDTLVDIHRNIRMAPASNTKLLTTGIALKLLGPDYGCTAEALLRTVGKELTGSASYDGCQENAQ